MKAAYVAAIERPDILIKSDEVSDITFVRGCSPSLLARRTWNLLIQEAHGDGWQNKLHSIKKRDLCAGWHIGPNEIADVMEELQMTLIRRYTVSTNNKKARITTALLSSTIEEIDNDDTSRVFYSFTPELCDMLNSDYYVELEKLVYCAFDCKYSHPLYERGVRNIRNKRFMEILRLEDLRAIFGVPKGTLPRWDSVKRYVIEPAVAEVNHLCPTFTVQWHAIQDKTTKRHNPPVVAIQFVYVPNSPDKEVSIRKELDSSRIGRIARRKNNVEMIKIEAQQQRAELEADLKETNR